MGASLGAVESIAAETKECSSASPDPGAVAERLDSQMRIIIINSAPD
jgi:hypothetical protein